MGRNRYFARFRRYFEPAWAEIATLHDFFDKAADFERKMTAYALICQYIEIISCKTGNLVQRFLVFRGIRALQAFCPTCSRFPNPIASPRRTTAEFAQREVAGRQAA
jgi:hypothetical protein